MRKNILITGASTGLGEGMAREWAAKGCNLALCARRADKLQALQRELQQAHPDIRVLVRGLDVCDYDQVFAVFRGFREELGSLDRVVRVVKTLGFVNSADDFVEQPKVINGCSDLFAELYGGDTGVGARSALPANTLPGGIAVEIEMIVEVTPEYSS